MNATLTEREGEFVMTIAQDQYMDGDPSGSTWTVSVCETPADKALLGSLVKKGYAHTNGEACGLTAKGLEFYRGMVEMRAAANAPSLAERIDMSGFR